MDENENKKDNEMEETIKEALSNYKFNCMMEEIYMRGNNHGIEDGMWQGRAFILACLVKNEVISVREAGWRIGLFESKFKEFIEKSDIAIGKYIVDIDKRRGIGDEMYNRGLTDGIKEGFKQGKIKTLVSVVKEGLITSEEAAKILKTSKKKFEELMTE